MSRVGNCGQLLHIWEYYVQVARIMSRSIVLIIAVLFFGLSCTAQSDTVFNQIDANGLKQGFWKRTMTDNGNPYLYAVESYSNGKRNGLCTYFFQNGKRETESYYKNDTLDGLSKIFRSYGGLRYEEPFKNGRTHGFKKYYSVNGNLTEEQEYKEGVQTGTYRMYSKSGRVIVESFYTNGIENGTRKVYSDNDKHEIIKEFDFKNDIKVAARYYKKGRVIKQEEYQYEDGLKKDEELKRNHQNIED
jgi:antitoxin component YwqK of YwqJK toxin-antitoxin module